MTDDFTPIRPQPAPLSRPGRASAAAGHADIRREQLPSGRDGDQRQLWLLLAGAALLLGTVFIGVPRWLAEPTAPAESALTEPDAAMNSDQGAAMGVDAPTGESAEAASGLTAGTGAHGPGDARNGSVATADAVNAPFASLERQQAETAARAALTRFVEAQQAFDARFHAGDWARTALDTARSEATRGDEAFVANRFDVAIAAYTAAADRMAALLADADTALDEALTAGAAALAARDPLAATQAFTAAADVAPADDRVTQGQARSALLPEVNELLRTARNHELNEAWSDALASLRAAERLDPETTDLSGMIARVTAGAARQALQDQLSRGFAALAAGQPETAREAFNAAERLDPGNAAARGGLEQVARAVEQQRLTAMATRIRAALAAESWDEALKLCTEALAIDPNLDFALSGRAQAQAQAKAATALDAIIADPEQLSSNQAFAEAGTVLETASALAPRGEALADRIARVEALLAYHAQPVTITLRSDATTEVTLSSVGSLGRFSEKQLAVRPGAYTLLGSRDGCRDIRTRIVVTAAMDPIDIRCTEPL